MEYKNSGNTRRYKCGIYKESLPSFPIIPPQKELKGVTHTKDGSIRKQNIDWLLGGSAPVLLARTVPSGTELKPRAACVGGTDLRASEKLRFSVSQKNY